MSSSVALRMECAWIEISNVDQPHSHGLRRNLMECTTTENMECDKDALNDGLRIFVLFHTRLKE